MLRQRFTSLQCLTLGIVPPLSALLAPSALAQRFDVSDALTFEQKALLHQRLSTTDSDLHELLLPEGLPERFRVQTLVDGRLVDLRFARHSMRTDDFKIVLADEHGYAGEMVPPPVHTYRLLDATGLESTPESLHGWASLVDGRLEAGLFWNDGQARGIEIVPVATTLPEAGVGSALHAVIDERDGLPMEGTCGVDEIAPQRHGGGGANTYGPSTTYGVVAAYLDACFVDLFTGSTLDEKLSAAVIRAEAIHAAENSVYGVPAIDIQHVIGGFVIESFTPTSCAPTVSSQTALSNFGNLWQTTYMSLFPQVGDAHLFNGAGFTDGTVIGRAWLGGWCNPGLMYAVNDLGYPQTVNAQAHLVAHERGHNWNANHCSGGNCDIMLPSMGSFNPLGSFGSASTTAFNNFAPGTNCTLIGNSNLVSFLESFTSGVLDFQRWGIAVNAAIEPSPLNASDNMLALSNPTTGVLDRAAVLETLPINTSSITIPMMSNLKIEMEVFDSLQGSTASLGILYLDRVGNWVELPDLSMVNLAKVGVSTPYEVRIPWDELYYGELRLRFEARNLASGEKIYIDDIWIKFETEFDHTINSGTYMASGDLNFDGQDDLVIGHPLVSNGQGSIGLFRSGSASAVGAFSGATVGEGLGSEIEVLDDLNGDNFPELAVGGNGIVRVFDGAGLAATPVQWNHLFGGPLSGTAGDEFGMAISRLGDVDGDGTSDFAVGAPGANGNTGRVDVRSGTTGAAIATLNGLVVGDRFGGTLDWVERADTQSEPDLVVGMRYNSTGAASSQRPARVQVFSGRLVGGALPLVRTIADTGVLSRLNGTDADPQFGWEVCGIGDFDGDGFSDVAIGIIGNLKAFAGGPIAAGGHVWIVSASPTRPTDVLLFGEAYAGYFGLSMEKAGDMNRDGLDDFVVGAPFLDRFVQGGGAVYAMVGPDGLTGAGSPYRVDYGMLADDRFGYNVSAGDYDGDSQRDFAVSGNRNCTMFGCFNSTSVYTGYKHSSAYSTVAHGSTIPGQANPSLMIGINNNFAGGGTIEIRDIPTTAIPYLVIGTQLSTAFGSLGITHGVLPGSSVIIAPDANGSFTWSINPPTGLGLTYHQLLMLTATNLGGSNIIARTY